MADQLPTSNSYKNLGGINVKASKYEMSTAQFLDLRNLDFDVPNALQKRPGSTFAIGSSNGTSGPISSLFEFVKLTGESYIVAGSDTAMFYIANNAFTLLSPGWTNGQPTDMLTFVNKLWMANGQKWQWFTGSSVYPAGLPAMQKSYLYTLAAPTNIGATIYLGNYQSIVASGSGATNFLVGGATQLTIGTSMILRGVFLAYSYIRSDGYWGPVDFQNTARNLITNDGQVAAGADYFNGTGGGGGVDPNNIVGGFTVPTGQGITAIALWIGVDTITRASTALFPDGSNRYVGALGYAGLFQGNSVANFMGMTLKPGANLARFQLYTIIPTSQLFARDLDANGSTFWAITLSPSFSTYDQSAPVGFGWSGMSTDFFASFTPKYIEQSNNTMFISGFSSSPSSVAFSEIGGPETYFPESTFEVRTNDGDRIYGIKSFNNQMLFAKEHSFAKLIGSNADNYQLVELSTDFGCLSNNTMLIKEQTMYWLDRKGILEYNGANWKIVSDPVEWIFRRMNISAAKEKAVGVHNMYRNQLWWGIPVDGSTTNNITVVYDYLVGAWTFFDGYNPASFAYNKGALSKPTAWRGDYSGLVHYTGESFYSDSSHGITCLGFTRYENQGGEQQTTLWRRFFLDVATATGLTGTINGQVFSNYDTSTIQATFTMYQSQFQSRAEMGINGKAVAAQFSHSSASLPLLINGYSWANRPLRNV